MNIALHILSINIQIHIQDLQITEETLSYTDDEQISLVEYRNLFMITVKLPLLRRKRSSNPTVISDGYDISLSYDGINFGDNISIIIYDDQHYSCNSTTKYCETMLDNPQVSLSNIVIEIFF